MADTQPLIAAFAFGIVANAASAAAFIYVKANGPPIFQDSLRLVLVIFLISSALWSVIDFAALNIEATSGCQVAVAFGAAFDQLARSSFQQFLLWGMDGGVRLSWKTFVPQLAIVCRFVLAGVYVGFQRSHFHPVCISSSLVMPLAVSLLGVDALILFFLLAKLMVVGDNNKKDSEEAQRSKTMLLAVAAAGFWTAMSAPMTLGVKSINLFLRKTLPAIGILAVIVVVLLAKERLLDTVDEIPKIAVTSPATRHYRMSDLVRNAASRRSNPRMSTFQQPPTNRFSDRKQGETTTSVTALQDSYRNKELPAISAPKPGQSERGIGGLPVQGQLFPPMRPQPPPTVLGMQAFETPPAENSKRNKKRKASQTGRPTISGPILREDSSNPLERIATVDLDTAARAEEQRRAAHPQPLESHSVGGRGPVALSDEELLQRSKSVGERKAVGQIPIIKTNLEPILESGGTSMTSSAQLSPGVENMRQRSPRLSQLMLSRQTPPPLPPLKTPGTVKNLAVPSPAQPDVWDLLAVSEEDDNKAADEGGSAPEIPPRSPLREQPAERPSTSPAARSIATMTQTSQPDATGRHRRSQSVSSRRSRPRDKMFIDTRTPPPIPQKCMDRKSFLPAETVYVDAPPPYKFNGKSFTSPQRVEANFAVVDTAQSPLSKPESKLSLFPPSYSKNGLDSPKQKAEAAVKAALAVKPAIAEAPGTLPLRPRNRSHTTANVTTNNVPHSQLPLRTTTLVTPIDKPLPASPSIPNLVRESVLNRPRPVTRTPETARFLTSYTHRPNVHRRSASCGSIRSKKSIVHAEALGSPSGLPPLPPVPLGRTPVIQGSAGDTRSMTVEEKMVLFNSSSDGLNRKRRSMSMPEIPQLPAAALPAMPLDPKAIQTARSTMTSVRTQSILNIADLGGRPGISRNTTEAPLQVSTSKIEHTEGPQTPPSPDPATPLKPEEFSASTKGSQQQSDISNETIEETPNSNGPSSKDSWELDSSDFDSVQGEEAFTVTRPSKPILVSSLKSSSDVYQAIAGSVDNTYRDRLGSSPPSFSSRSYPINMSRRGPPPHPLLLNRTPKTLIVETEPSPLESPDQALDMLEQQLQKLERSSRTSSVAQEQRMTLLADLEKEMGMQETNWQNLRHTMVRDSLSTLTASPQQVNQVGSLWAKVLENRGSRLALEPTNSVGSVEGNSRLGQQRLSLLTVSHPTTAQLGSPTPPDTDEDVDIPVILDDLVHVSLSPPSLWRAEVPSPKILKQEACLWSPSASVSFVVPDTELSSTLPPSQGKSTRPALEIESSQLWTPKVRAQEPATGLWGLPVPSITFDTSEEPETPKPRPLTVRPPRKSKRITTLPDILESPKPLSTRHDTLGIFQFPWGEKSHTGTIPLPVFGALPGTMTSGRAQGNTTSDPVFSSTADGEGSFFDDRDEEDIGDNFDDFDDEDDGDDFDETTLWEIASLLRSDKFTTQTRVVSGEWLNNSTRRTSVVASPTESIDSPQCAAIPVVLDVSSSCASATKVEKRTLWERKSQFYTVEKGFGLKQPNRKSWEKYLGAVEEQRCRKGSTDEPMTVHINGLWELPEPVRARSGALWVSQVDDEAELVQKTRSGLWEMTPGQQQPNNPGLWSLASADSSSLGSPKPLTGLSMRPIPRKASRELPVTPEATSLWFGDKQPVSSPDWRTTQTKTPSQHLPDFLADDQTQNHRVSSPKEQTLWSRVVEQKPVRESTGTWEPQLIDSATRAEASPKLHPRYERKSSFPTAAPEVQTINQQTLWKRPTSSSGGSGEGPNWLSKSRKHRTFQEDVDTVQEYLAKRWGGL